jgi:hypothetical protein
MRQILSSITRPIVSDYMTTNTIKRCRADLVLPAKVRDQNSAYSLEQNRDDLGLGKSTLLHSNLLVDVTEKIPIPNPFKKVGITAEDCITNLWNHKSRELQNYFANCSLKISMYCELLSKPVLSSPVTKRINKF